MYKEVKSFSEFMSFVEEFIDLYENNIRISFALPKKFNEDLKEYDEKAIFPLVLSAKGGTVYWKELVNRKEYLDVIERLKEFKDGSRLNFPIIQYEYLGIGSNIQVVFLGDEIGRI